MSVRHAKRPTTHGLKRLKSRVGIKSKKVGERIILEASKGGKNIMDFPPGEFREYLISKDHGKRVKVYKGIVFIFNKTSDRCITCYPIPKEHLEEYEQYGK